MRWRDILALAFSALWQQKVRTLLTLLGVMFGGFVLAASLAIGQGVQNAIRDYIAKNEILRRVEAMPRWDDETDAPATQPVAVPGDMSDARRQRLQRALARHRSAAGGRHDRVKLNEEMIAKLRALPHVETVVPLPWIGGFTVLGDAAQPFDAGAVRPGDEQITRRIVAGRMLERPDEDAAVVSESLLYRLGVLNEADVQSIIGHKVRVEIPPRVSEGGGFALFIFRPRGEEPKREEAAALEKVRRQLPGALDKFDLSPEELALLRSAAGPATAPASQPAAVSREFTIVGVIRAATEEDELPPWDPYQFESDVALPYDTATRLFFDVPGWREFGINRAVITVDRDENVKAVRDEVRTFGLRAHAAIEFIERQRLMFLLIFGGMTCVAGVAMIVAALGITNTMLISVLERTREIGIMKAVGARNGHLQAIFLVEGALIGAAGGGLGLLLAWAVSFPGDAWVRGIASNKLETVITNSIFVFPAWLQMAVVGSATLVTILAAVYPARRAARLDPVTALRHV